VPQQLPPPQVLGDVGEWFRRLTAADTGILYEDTYLQVGAGFPGLTDRPDAAARAFCSCSLSTFVLETISTS
jgi:hypothetical protein